MARKNVRFVAFKTVRKPTKVRFKMRSGKTVSFKAYKIGRKKEVVRFPAKKR